MQSQNQHKQQNDLLPYILNAQKILRTKGEYLTSVHNVEYSKISKFLVPLSAQPELSKRRINAESAINSIIQTSYLCYVAFWYRIKISVPAIYYDKRDLKASQPLNFFIGYHIINTNEKIELIKMVHETIRDIVIMYNKFENPADVIIKNFANQYERLCQQAKFSNTKEKDFMLCLEQTQLFKKHSFLLRIKNSSILNIIKSDESRLASLVERKLKEKQLIQQHNKLKKDKANDHKARLQEIQQDIQKNIKEFFSMNLKGCTRFTEMEYANNDPFKVKFFLKFHERNIAISENQKLQKEALAAKQKQMSFQKDIQKIINKNLVVDNNLKVTIPISTLEFQIEYSSERNSICVKLMTEIALSVETSDFLMFQSNNLSFDSSNISLELIERSVPNSVQKNRFIALKGSSCFTQKQPPLEKILLLIDIAMINFKIMEPEIIKSGINNKDYLRPQELHRKINHYIAIINFVTKKVYATNEERTFAEQSSNAQMRNGYNMY